jgi:hypothetical protein
MGELGEFIAMIIIGIIGFFIGVVVGVQLDRTTDKR